MTQQQIRWAASHDWFIQDNGNGTITILDRLLNTNTGELTETTMVWSRSFKALRDWAGY